jgi:SAM-dependent methyltransferase
MKGSKRGSAQVGAIRGWVRRQNFNPSWAGMLVNPFSIARRGLLQVLRRLGPAVHGRTLDVGCGRKPYKPFFRSTEYVGLEVDSPAARAASLADVYYDGQTFPFEDRSFDSVVATQVLEHVPRPGDFLAEIHRVLRDGGVLLLTVPFVWDEHEQPRDFTRFTSFGVRRCVEEAGFDVQEASKSVTDVRVIFQLANAYLYKSTLCRHAWINRLSTLCLMAPLALAGEALAPFLPSSEDLYLDNVVLARKRSHT